uniref:Photosystem I assembly protein Ycf4 n=1 Tax=Cumathamnion serrulatum TaxID=1206573 RepID=A0A7U1AQZ9_9FLOR|nr:photosystem I assembly protein ycf4 [Cumathamnion serrulatum]QQY85329.1 photosystem I assembly protein ycf4 [Cumathamnion serrulatum]
MSDTKIDKILGSRRFSNYWWASTILIGGLGFFIVGISSYFKYTFIPLIKNENILFLPQGIIMIFYGIIGILISIFLWYTIVLNIGSGYNKFDNNKGIITIFRLGFPGKNRILKLNYEISEIACIKLVIEEGFSTKREIYLKMKDKREIPLTKVGRPLALSEIEEKAINIAIFLGVNVEGID